MRETSTSQPMGSDMFSRSFSTRYRPAPEQTEPTRHDVEHSTRSPPQCPRAGSGVPAYEFGVKSVVSLIVWRVASPRPGTRRGRHDLAAGCTAHVHGVGLPVQRKRVPPRCLVDSQCAAVLCRRRPPSRMSTTTHTRCSMRSLLVIQLRLRCTQQACPSRLERRRADAALGGDYPNRSFELDAVLVIKHLGRSARPDDGYRQSGLEHCSCPTVHR